jgi:hypothetical protein
MTSDSDSTQPPSLSPPHITFSSGMDGNIVDDVESHGSNTTQGNLRQLVPSPGLYAAPAVAESSEMLLPPSQAKWHLPDSRSSRSRSAISSRRTSWSSDRDSRQTIYKTPFDGPYSKSSSRFGDSDEGLNTQTVSEKFNIMPSAELLLFPEDVEKDDYLHNPGQDDKDDKCHFLSNRALMNVGGLVLITIGVLVLFIGYPILYALHT